MELITVTVMGKRKPGGRGTTGSRSTEATTHTASSDPTGQEPSPKSHQRVKGEATTDKDQGEICQQSTLIMQSTHQD